MTTRWSQDVRALLALVIGAMLSTSCAPGLPGEVTVSIPAGTAVPGCEESDMCFIPFRISVADGGEVTWTNDDQVAHTVTSGTPEEGPDGTFDSGLFLAGGSFTHQFATTGEHPYFCQVHPWQTGIVVVGE